MSNEALRLAEILEGGSPQFNHEAAALLRQQAERIAELEARVHTCGPTCSKAGCINRRLTAECDQLRIDLDDELCNREVLDTMLTQCIAERDQLRAEVERLRVDAERWHFANLTAETAWKHPDHRSQEENTAFSAYRCAVEDGLNFEGAVDAAVAAIDHARTTHKDEG